MTCTNMEEKISLYLDNQLSVHEEKELKEHLKTCETCSMLFEDMKLIHETLADLPELPLPETFESELHEKLIQASAEIAIETDEESGSQQTPDRFSKDDKKYIRIPMPNWKVFKRYSKQMTAVAATLLIAVVAVGSIGYFREMSYRSDYETAVSETAANDSMVYGEMPSEPVLKSSMSEAKMAQSVAVEEAVEMDNMEMDETASGFAPNIEENATSGQKEAVDKQGRMIIYTADIAVDVVDYDTRYDEIVNKVNFWGGYIGEANTSYRYYNESNPDASLKYGYLRVRVPQERFMEFLDYVRSLGIERDVSISSNDVTAQYRDLSNEVANLEVREAKLREIMDDAEDVEDVITVERELSRVRGEINSYMGTLKEWERLASLSTVYISLNEVETLEPKIKPLDKSLMQKAREGFIMTINQLKRTAEILFIGIVALSPKLLLWGIFLLVGYKIVKWLLFKFKNRK